MIWCRSRSRIFRRSHPSERAARSRPRTVTFASSCSAFEQTIKRYPHQGSSGDEVLTGRRVMAKNHNDNGEVRLKGKEYNKELSRLQGELCKLQDWVKYKGLRVIVVFEGRDAAGKGGTIRAITERVSPRVFRLVALPAPSDREKSQMYLQRYIQHFPAAGEIVIFDRSW